MILIEFQVTCSKFTVKVKPLFSAHCVVRLISFDPFTWSIPNLVQGLPSMSRWFLLIFRSHVQRSKLNHSSQPAVLSDRHLLTPSLDQYQTWCRGYPQWVDDPYWFSGHILKVKVKLLFWAQCVVYLIYFNPLLSCFGQDLLLQRR